MWVSQLSAWLVVGFRAEQLVVGESTLPVYSAKEPQEKCSFSLVEIPSAVVLSWVWSSWEVNLAVSAETRAWRVSGLRRYSVVQRPGLRSSPRGPQQMYRAVAGKLGDPISVPLGNPPMQMVQWFCSWNFSLLVETLEIEGELSSLESKQFSK